MPAAAATAASSEAPTRIGLQLPPALGSKGPVVQFPLLKLDTAAASELANLSLQHLVLGALPPAARVGAVPGSRPQALPAGAEIAGSTSLALQRGSPARLWQGRVISVAFSAEGCGAYCEDYRLDHAFDARSGRDLLAQDLFSAAGLEAVSRRVHEAQVQRLEGMLTTLRRARQVKPLGREATETLDAQRAMYEECLATRQSAEARSANRSYPGGLRFGEAHLEFSHDRCSNHAARAIDELGDFVYRIPVADLAPHWSPYGRSLALGSAPGSEPAEPDPTGAGLRVYRGRIDGRIAVTLFLRLEAAQPYDTPMAGTLYYDRVGSPIRLQVDPVPGRAGQLTMLEQTEAAAPGRIDVQLDRASGVLTGQWQQAGAKPLSFEATVLRGR